MNFFTVKFTQILFGFRFGGVSEKALLFSIRSFASKKQIEKTNFLFSSLSLRERRMGSSSSKKKQPRNRPQDLKLMVVGDRAVGKTSLLFTSITNDFPEEHIPTVFDNYSTNCFYQNTQFEIGLWDTAGDEVYDRLRPLSYPGTDIFFLCYSVEDSCSLENIKAKWLPEIHQHCPPNTPFIVVGLKTDLRDDEETIEQLKQTKRNMVSQEEGLRFALEVGASQYMECSSKTFEGLKEVFEMVNHVMFDEQPPLLTPTYNVKGAKR